MSKAVGITLKEKGRINYYVLGNLHVKKNLTVIVSTEHGLQFGKIVTDVMEVDISLEKQKQNHIIRIATREDYYQHKKNLADAKLALKKCRELVKKNELNMYMMDASYTFDRDQLIFHFLSDGRVDFRKLAKDLASQYRTRIELRQIGARDKAKEIGGIGPCGQELCCRRFLDTVQSVSISMAKNQNLSLNPNKINGSCGRLLCCLKYEDDCYTDCRKQLPNIGEKVKTNKGEGTVTTIDVLKQKYQVNVPNEGLIEMELPSK